MSKSCICILVVVIKMAIKWKKKELMMVTYNIDNKSKHLKGQLWPCVGNVFVYSCPIPLPGHLWPRFSDVFVYLNHQSDLLLNSWESPKMYPPKLYSGPTIQSRSGGRRATQDLVQWQKMDQNFHIRLHHDVQQNSSNITNWPPSQLLQDGFR